MATISQSSGASETSPAAPTGRQTTGRAAAYSRQQLHGGRIDAQSLGASRTRSNNSHLPADHALTNSRSTNDLSTSVRGHRVSSRAAGEYRSTAVGDKLPSLGDLHGIGRAVSDATSTFTPLARRQSLQYQPNKPVSAGLKAPGTPGARMRMPFGGNAAMKPFPMTPQGNSSSLAYTFSMSSAPTTSPTRASASAAATSGAPTSTMPKEDVLCTIFANCLPTAFDALAKYQFQQATSVLDKWAACNLEDDAKDVRREWKNWDAFAVMIRLAASCESSYHLMKYLEADMLHKETLDQLYNKLTVLLNHIVEDIQPVVRRAQLRSGGGDTKNEGSKTLPMTKGATLGSEDHDIALMSELDRLTTGDLEYYYGVLDQASEFFALRVPMIELYRGLATQPPPHNYAGMAKTLDRLMQRYQQFDHPLLATLQQSTVEELRTVKAAFESEVCIGQYDFTKSMVTLHRFKASLRMWSDHIDSVSDYPLFDESDDDADIDGDDCVLSTSQYSNSTSQGSSTLYMQQHAAAVAAMARADSGDYMVPPPPPTSVSGSLSRPQRESSFRRKSFTQALATSSEMLAFAAATEQARATSAAMAMATMTTTVASSGAESQNAFSRLLSQKGLLLKRGLSYSSLRSKSQIGRDAAPSAGAPPPTTPSNTLEHAILGSTPSVVNGIANSMLTPGGNALNSVGTSGASGFNTTNSLTLAAEMMASAVAKQEREDGYALPVYQWSKRFYRSLLAKFTLYFHHWLEPFESRGDALSPYDLTRFIRSPVGISYLQLIDVLLAKGSHRIEDGSASVMIVMDTGKLNDKGAKFYAKGYLCPGYSNSATIMIANSGEKAVALRQNGASASLSSSQPNSTSNGRQPTSTSTSQSNNYGGQSHGLFNLSVEPEPEDEDSSDDFAPLWGLRGWPAVFCYPQPENPPLQHWPNIVSLIMDNRPVIERQSGARVVPFVHTERRLKVSYYITSLDPALYLVLLLEGKRRPSERTAQDFMQTMTENLQHNGVYQRGGAVPVSLSG